jgi:hypothetical protein
MSNYLNIPYQDLYGVATSFKRQYAEGIPFPHISFPNFFNPDFLEEVLAEFPDLSLLDTYKFKNPNEIKLASKGENGMGPKTREFVHFLNSESFLKFLQELTSIKETLLGDPYLVGAGLHEIKRGGLLKVHADFNKHSLTGLDRRLNVLVYLNKDWKEEYGGHFELWDRNMQKADKKILPTFNTLAMFSTTDFSYHGHPDPLNCPSDRSRKSIALYYYSNGRPAEEVNQGLQDHSTIFKARKGHEKEVVRQQINWKQQAKRFIPPVFLDIIKK